MTITCRSIVRASSRFAVDNLSALYSFRFPVDAQRRRDAIWRVLCAHFFQRYVRESDTVLELGCGYGEFIRNIRAGRKIAVDVNPDVKSHLDSTIDFYASDAAKLSSIDSASIDLCFSSNFFEHLPSKSAMDDVLAEARRVLRPGGRYVAMQPNLRYALGEYWDYYDHVLPLTDRSCAEAFAKAGFALIDVIDRFVPFSTASRLPQSPLLVRLYLACPLAWRILGRQFVVVAERPRGD
jgi:SAM-dependent methyltransferase